MTEYFIGDVEFFVAADDTPMAVATFRAASPDNIEEDINSYLGRRIVNLPTDLEPRAALTRVFGFYKWRVTSGQDGSVTKMVLPSAGVEDHVADTPDALFDKLASYVREGSHVQMVSSDGAAWSRHFRGGAPL
jgi:hypothetical protein